MQMFCVPGNLTGGVSRQLLQRLSGLVQKTMDTKNNTKETMDPNSENNRAAS